MEKLTAKAFWQCQSSKEFTTKVKGSKDNIYTVRFGYQPFGKYQYDYSCECWAFRKNKKCKHIDQVKESGEHCNWSQFTDGGDVVKRDNENCCPNCGLPVFAQDYGV
jgi:hypothetical protein